MRSSLTASGPQPHKITNFPILTPPIFAHQTADTVTPLHQAVADLQSPLTILSFSQSPESSLVTSIFAHATDLCSYSDATYTRSLHFYNFNNMASCYIIRFSGVRIFQMVALQPFGSIQLIPSACILNYGQAIIEDLRAYKKQDDSILLFRPEEHGLRMTVGANRLCMPAPTIQQFVEAVKDIVLANRRWVMQYYVIY
ncbi:hypothetical protein Patl1_08763 [Pistacia atlantica]|uniref:Uncharacterized protein n=1 Tax=Pistacia atlantica TaxID=434234 RepID=A0ACC1AIA8_9ROSI|nr:hypothetical protein Patl1_08763 [Pistacia atlantica]